MMDAIRDPVIQAKITAVKETLAAQLVGLKGQWVLIDLDEKKIQTLINTHNLDAESLVDLGKKPKRS